MQGDDGASLVEYVLLVSLIALLCIGGLRYFQSSVEESFDSSASAISEASP